MGFYIRKALSVGPLRFNLSKSGIGVSAGIKGFRIGSGPRGNYIHMGRGGLYFRQSLDSPRRLPSPSGSGMGSPVDAGTAAPLEEIDSGAAQSMVDCSSADLLKEMNEKRRMLRFLPFALAMSGVFLLVAILADAPVWLIAVGSGLCILGCCYASMKDDLRKTTVVMYELDPEVESAFESLHAAFDRLCDSARVWHIGARGNVLDTKYHAGASSLVRRDSISPRVGNPPFVKTNLLVPLIHVGRQTLAFMPDRVLVFDASGVGSVAYAALRLRIEEARFIEDGAVPHDARVVGRTWRYVNKGGGPDKRFKNNPELPICAYEELHLSSGSGLNEVLQVSRRGVGAQIASSLGAMSTVSAAQPKA